MRTEGQLNNIGGGKYNGIAIVTMAGVWHVTGQATRDGKTIGQRTTRMPRVPDRSTEKPAPRQSQNCYTIVHAT